MTWGKVDDQLHSHPKPEEAKLEAMGLWVLGLSYCCAYLTDGFITPERVRRIAGNRGAVLAAKLVTARLWEVVEGGWQYHDWAHYQPTREDALAERERKRLAGKKGGETKAARIAEAKAHAVAPASGLLAELALPPSRPVPSPYPEQSQTRTREASGDHPDPEVQKLVAAIEAEPKFRAIPPPDIRALAVRAMPEGNRKPIAWHMNSIQEAAADTPTGELAHLTQKRLRAYLDRSKAPEKRTEDKAPSGPAYRDFDFEPGELDSFSRPARKTIGGK
jgi:hypothetical protein